MLEKAVMYGHGAVLLFPDPYSLREYPVGMPTDLPRKCGIPYIGAPHKNKGIC